MYQLVHIVFLRALQLQCFPRRANTLIYLLRSEFRAIVVYSSAVIGINKCSKCSPIKTPASRGHYVITRYAISLKLFRVSLGTEIISAVF